MCAFSRQAVQAGRLPNATYCRRFRSAPCQRCAHFTSRSPSLSLKLNTCATLVSPVRPPLNFNGSLQIDTHSSSLVTPLSTSLALPSPQMANSNPRQQSSRTSTSTTLVGAGTNSSPPGNAFSAALEDFKNSVSNHHLTQFKNITYDDLCKEIIEIQNKQDSRREMMHLSRIQSCLEAMKQFGQIIDLFVNVSNEVAFIWGPMKFLLLVFLLQ